MTRFPARSTFWLPIACFITGIISLATVAGMAVEKTDTAEMIRKVDAQIEAARMELKNAGKALDTDRKKRTSEIQKYETGIQQIDIETLKMEESIREQQEIMQKLQQGILQQVAPLREIFFAVADVSDGLRKSAKGSLWELSEPGTVELISIIRGDLNTERKKIELSATAIPESFSIRLRALIELMAIQQGTVRAVAAFKAEVVLPSGSVEMVEGLRFGELSAYCTLPDGSGALVIRDPETNRWTAVHSFLSSSQRKAIVAIVTDPTAGGSLPMDLTGGVAIQVARTRRSFSQWFAAGGPLMYPIALVGLLAFLLVAQRTVYIAQTSSSVRLARSQIFEHLNAGNMDSAMNACMSLTGPLARVIRKGFSAKQLPPEKLETVLQEAILAEQPALEKHITTLAVLAGIAPLLGLLGTVTGMINTFRILTITGSSDPRALSGGISEALITTQAGLLVAVPIILLHGGIRRYVTSLADSIHLAAVSLVNRISILNSTADKETVTGIEEKE